jgi:hypothetical protein
MSRADEVTGAQVRMARAFLRWSVADLAAKAKVGISTVQRIEAEDGPPNLSNDLRWRIQAREKSIAAVRFALERAGIKFLADDGDGIGVRGKLGKKQP